MTNYNERLDEIFYQYRDEYNAWQANPRGSGTNGIKLQNRAKQAITSLIKELVAEAKPAEKDQLAQSTLDDESRCRFYRYGGYNFAINEFEQNILKALEEV